MDAVVEQELHDLQVLVLDGDEESTAAQRVQTVHIHVVVHLCFAKGMFHSRIVTYRKRIVEVCRWLTMLHQKFHFLTQIILYVSTDVKVCKIQICQGANANTDMCMIYMLIHLYLNIYIYTHKLLEEGPTQVCDEINAIKLHLKCGYE